MATNTFTLSQNTVIGDLRCVIGTLSWADATTSNADATVSALSNIYSLTSNHGATLRFHDNNVIGSDDATAGSTMVCMITGIPLKTRLR